MQVPNRVNKLNMDVKCEFFSKKISSYADDVKGSWKIIINQFLNKNSKTTRVSCLSVEGETILGIKVIALESLTVPG